MRNQRKTRKLIEKLRRTARAIEEEEDEYKFGPAPGEPGSRYDSTEDLVVQDFVDLRSMAMKGMFDFVVDLRRGTGDDDEIEIELADGVRRGAESDDEYGVELAAGISDSEIEDLLDFVDKELSTSDAYIEEYELDGNVLTVEIDLFD